MHKHTIMLTRIPAEPYTAQLCMKYGLMILNLYTQLVHTSSHTQEVKSCV